MIGFLSALFLGKDVVKESYKKAGNDLDYQYNRYNIPRQCKIMDGDNEEILKELQMTYIDMQLAIMWNFNQIKGAFEVNKAVNATLAKMQLEKEGYNFSGDTFGLHRTFYFLDKSKLQASAKALRRLMEFSNPDAPPGENRQKLELMALGGDTRAVNDLKSRLHNNLITITNESEFQAYKATRLATQNVPWGDVLELFIDRICMMNQLSSCQVREEYANHVILSKMQGKKPMTFGQYMTVVQLKRFMREDVDFVPDLNLDDYDEFVRQTNELSEEHNLCKAAVMVLWIMNKERAFENWNPEDRANKKTDLAHYPWILEDFTNRIRGDE